MFPEASLSLFLSGGMIFISHLLRSLYFFISQSALHYMFGSFQSHLTKTYYWRYRVTTDIQIILCQYLLCYKDLTDLHHKLTARLFLTRSKPNLHTILTVFLSSGSHLRSWWPRRPLWSRVTCFPLSEREYQP